MDWLRPSEEIDRELGFRVQEIELELLNRARRAKPGGNLLSWGSALHEGNQTWVGLHPEAMQTPYQELLRMCSLIKLSPGEKVVDFGAGYGRLGIILKKLYPGTEFSGIEFVSERVEEGKRIFALHGLDPDSLREGDLTAEDFFPEEAHHYFVYDFGKVPHIRRLLRQLGDIADRKKFTLTGRGKGIQSLISHEFPWLTPIAVEEKFTVYTF
jgi:hypothetical protein